MPASELDRERPRRVAVQLLSLPCSLPKRGVAGTSPVVSAGSPSRSILIALYAGIDGIAALLGIAGVNVAMILFGWLQESSNRPERLHLTMRPFRFGCIAGAAPWAASPLAS